MSDLDLRQRTMDIVSYVIKPKVVHGNVAVAKVGDTPIPMPVFKANKRLGMAILASGKNRNAAADYLMETLREEGALFEDGSTGLVASMLQAGVDPNSMYVKDVLQRLSVRLNGIE